MDHLDAFQHLHSLKGTGRTLGFASQGLAGFMGLEKPLDQLEGKRKVLEAKLSTCQHSHSISKSRKWWECSLQCIGKQTHTTDNSCVLWLGNPPAPGASLPGVASGILHEPGKILDG